jgi:hypothetical protein
MLNPTVTQRWTIATWLVSGIDHADRIAAPFGVASGHERCDAIALQSVRHAVADAVATELSMQCTWALSHYPKSPLFRSHGVGLAMLTPHRIRSTHDQVVSKKTSTWSNDRRIAQQVLLERDDHSAYAIVHAVPPIGLDVAFPGNAPTVVLRPVQVGIDVAGAVRLPDQARLVSSDTSTPESDRQPLLRVSFEQEWVRPDLPIA